MSRFLSLDACEVLMVIKQQSPYVFDNPWQSQYSVENARAPDLGNRSKSYTFITVTMVATCEMVGI